MTISAILHSREGETITANQQESVGALVARLAQCRIGAVPIVESGRVIGIFSERDVIYGLAQMGEHILKSSVGEIMTTPAITVTADTPVMSALSLMTRRRIRHLPVVENGLLIGLVSIGDLVKFRIEKIEAEANAMRDYIQKA